MDDRERPRATLVRRSALVATGIAVLLAATLTVIAAGRDDAARTVTGPAGDTIRMTRWYRIGPSAVYGLDYGNIGVVDPTMLALPPGTYDVVVTLSFDARTSANDTFDVGVRGDDGEPRITPWHRPIAGTGTWDSTTVVFRAVGLAGDDTYAFEPWVNASFQRVGRARIVTERLLVVIDATPTV
jgi:hypothetical protein